MWEKSKKKLFVRSIGWSMVVFFVRSIASATAAAAGACAAVLIPMNVFNEFGWRQNDSFFARFGAFHHQTALAQIVRMKALCFAGLPGDAYHFPIESRCVQIHKYFRRLFARWQFEQIIWPHIAQMCAIFHHDFGFVITKLHNHRLVDAVVPIDPCNVIKRNADL